MCQQVVPWLYCQLAVQSLVCVPHKGPTCLVSHLYSYECCNVHVLTTMC